MKKTKIKLKNIKKKCLFCKKIFFTHRKEAKLCCLNCVHNYCKLHKIAIFNFKTRSSAGKLGAAKCKEQNVGAFFNKDIHQKVASMGGKAGAAICKAKQLGAFFNPSINLSIRKSTYYHNYRYKFQDIIFPSRGECELAMCIYYQYTDKLIEGYNVHVNIKGKEVDFVIQSFKCIIEYHTWFKDETFEHYYNRRRELLSNTLYKNYNLIVIK